MAQEPSYTILYVDDDRSICELVARVLTEVGYRILTATTAEDAFRTVRTTNVDLLITDIVMPGMSGIDLAHAAKRLRPALNVIFITGYAQKADPNTMRLGKTLFKPVRPREMVDAVKSLLRA